MVVHDRSWARVERSGGRKARIDGEKQGLGGRLDRQTDEGGRKKEQRKEGRPKKRRTQLTGRKGRRKDEGKGGRKKGSKKRGGGTHWLPSKHSQMHCLQCPGVREVEFVEYEKGVGCDDGVIGSESEERERGRMWTETAECVELSC